MDVSELALALALTLTLRVTGIRGPYTIATHNAICTCTGRDSCVTCCSRSRALPTAMAAPVRVQSVPSRRCTRCTSCGMYNTSTRQRCAALVRVRVRARARARARVRARKNEHAAARPCNPMLHRMEPYAPSRMRCKSAARLHDGVQPCASRLQPYAPKLRPSCTLGAPRVYLRCSSPPSRRAAGSARLRACEPRSARPRSGGSDWLAGKHGQECHARRSLEAPVCAWPELSWPGLSGPDSWMPKGGSGAHALPKPVPKPTVCCAFRHPGGALTKLKQREAAKLALRQVEVMSMPELE